MKPTSKFLSICAVAAASVGVTLPGCATRHSVSNEDAAKISAATYDNTKMVFFAPGIPTERNPQIADLPNVRVAFDKDGNVHVQKLSLILREQQEYDNAGYWQRQNNMGWPVHPGAGFSRTANFLIEDVYDPATANQVIGIVLQQARSVRTRAQSTANYENTSVYITDGLTITTAHYVDPQRETSGTLYAHQSLRVENKDIVPTLNAFITSLDKALTAINDGKLANPYGIANSNVPVAPSPATEALLRSLEAKTK